MTLNGQNALCCRKDTFLEPNAQMWMKTDPYYQRQRCRPMTLVSGNIRCMRIFVGFLLGEGRQVRVGFSTSAIFFLNLSGYRYFYGNFRDKTSNSRPLWRHASPCRSLTDCKMNDLEQTWVAISYENPFSGNTSWLRAFDFHILTPTYIHQKNSKNQNKVILNFSSSHHIMIAAWVVLIWYRTVTDFLEAYKINNIASTLFCLQANHLTLDPKDTIIRYLITPQIYINGLSFPILCCSITDFSCVVIFYNYYASVFWFFSPLYSVILLHQCYVISKLHACTFVTCSLNVIDWLIDWLTYRDGRNLSEQA